MKNPLNLRSPGASSHAHERKHYPIQGQMFKWEALNEEP